MLRTKYSNCNYIERNKLIIGKEIGRGHFGIAKLANYQIKKDENIVCVVKELKEECGNSKELMDEILRMKDLKHENIIQVYGFSFGKDQKPIMVMEYCTNDALDKRLKQDPKLSPQKMLNFSIQIADGMCYLASKDFVHRDLAARNMLLANDEKTIKIADFGLSRFLNGEKYYFGKNSKFPFLWTPPEFWENQTKFGKARRFSTKSDVWGFGVTMWEMFSYGKRPWEGREHEVIKLILQGETLEMPQDCPLQIWEVMKWCWAYDSSVRPDFKVIKYKLDEIDKEFDCESTPVSQVNDVDYTQGLSLVNNDSYFSTTQFDLSKDVYYVNMSGINDDFTQETERLNTDQSTSFHSIPSIPEPDPKAEHGEEANNHNHPHDILESEGLLNNNPSINDDPKSILKGHLALLDEDPKYRCLCGVHVVVSFIL